MADDDDIIRASRRTHQGRNPSEARRWIEENFDKLVETPPSWKALTQRLNASGMRSASGGKLTERHLVQAFYLVSKARRQSPRKPPARAAHPTAEPSDEPFQIRSINKETP